MEYISDKMLKFFVKVFVVGLFTMLYTLPINLILYWLFFKEFDLFNLITIKFFSICYITQYILIYNFISYIREEDKNNDYEGFRK